MSLFNLITTDERQQIDAAYAKTGECLARYQRCKSVLDSNANLNDGKQRVRNWLQALPETERELCRAVLNGITAAKRHYAAVKASGQPTKPSTAKDAPAMPTPAEREALRQSLANRTAGR
ncbi:hypothetical protein [Shewanella baltica]|uniref:hypothetical protein n=1 Tax=Shewanella baltica TaxID=62322 RepID=UPI0021676BB9|nr:hypothetical protein [Shewanella baltica]MCS6115261.1 hypothetical protein [Shewanella baltica]UVW63700.1 hypothetical protein HHE93_08915 [Shewanella baltica]